VNDLQRMANRSRKRLRALERDEKARQRYGVFVHSSGAAGGYVVRTGYLQPDGSVCWPSPYKGRQPVNGKVYRRERAAQQAADKLNRPPTAP
jgi:hypothetical protein